METIITYNVAEKYAEIYTTDKASMNKFDSLCVAFPDVYRLKKDDDVSKIYIVPKDHITFRKPPKMTEKQLENLNNRHNK